jgi:hypothetical protein
MGSLIPNRYGNIWKITEIIWNMDRRKGQKRQLETTNQAQCPNWVMYLPS